MCGRYTLKADGRDLWDVIENNVPKKLRKKLTPQQVSLILDDSTRRKYNVVPASYEPIALMREGELDFVPAHWWLLPSWGADKVTWKINKNGQKTFTWKEGRKSHFNSRWDTVTNPSNRYWNGLLNSNRCLIPADGFVEWPDDELRPKDQEKIPHYFFLKEHQPFFFAGIYDLARDDDGKSFLSYNIITVEPNGMLKKLPHHRMPGILTGESVEKWLDPSNDADKVKELLRPTTDEAMETYPISRLVNVAKNESPKVLEPLVQGNG